MNIDRLRRPVASCGAAVGQLEPAVFPVHLPVQQLKFSDSGPSQSPLGVTSSMHHAKGSRIYMQNRMA